MFGIWVLSRMDQCRKRMEEREIASQARQKNQKPYPQIDVYRNIFNVTLCNELPRLMRIQKDFIPHSSQSSPGNTPSLASGCSRLPCTTANCLRHSKPDCSFEQLSLMANGLSKRFIAANQQRNWFLLASMPCQPSAIFVASRSDKC